MNADFLSVIEQLRENIKQDIKAANDELHAKISEINDKLNPYLDKVAKLEEQLNNQIEINQSLQTIIRKKNIIIHGLSEEDKAKNLEESTILFLKNTLHVNINTNDVDFIYRIGAKTENKARPIKLGLLTTKKKTEILANRKNLKNAKIYINEDLPKEIELKRKQLVPLMKEYRKQGKQAYIRYDKLIVDGKPIQEPEEIRKKRSRSSNSNESSPSNSSHNESRRKKPIYRQSEIVRPENTKPKESSILNFFQSSAVSKN